MPAISKPIFDNLISPEFTCKKLLHPSTDSCFMSLIDGVLNAITGSSKFFLIIYMVYMYRRNKWCYYVYKLTTLLQSIIKWKKWNKHFMKKQVNAYCRSMLYAICYVTAFYSTACLMRKCIHQYHFLSVAVCGFNGGLAIFLESEENRNLNTAIYMNLVVETVFRYVYWKKLLTRNTLQETFLFMTCSATLMYLLQSKKTGNKITNLWFYYPSGIKSNVQDAKSGGVCTHATSCCNYFYEGFSAYFMVGYVTQLVKYILPRLNNILSDPRQMIKAVFSTDKFLFGLLLGSYVGIYRIVSCLLRRRDKEEKPFHALLAGFLAGFSYLFKPTLSIAAIAFTTAIQLTIERITCLNDLQSKFPAREIIFAISSGFLFHNRFFLPDSCPRYIKTMMNTASNGKVNEIYERTLHYFGPQLSTSAIS